MKRYAWAGLCITAVSGLAGCGPSLEKQAQEIAARDLVDPASAQFRDVRPVDGTKCVEGQINAKNRMGGYVGFRLFLVDMNKKDVAIVPDDGDDEAATIAKARVEIYKMDCGIVS